MLNATKNAKVNPQSVCVCSEGSIRYRHPSGELASAPVLYACHMHAPSVRAETRKRDAGVLALWRGFYRPLRLALPAPDACAWCNGSGTLAERAGGTCGACLGCGVALRA